MHKENQNENRQQTNLSLPSKTNSETNSETNDGVNELSEVWRELLGNRANGTSLSDLPADMPIPTLEVDPWSALLQAKGIEIFDLQQIHLKMSDQEVEQMLEVMQDEPNARRPGSQAGGENTSPDTARQNDTHLS